MSLFVGMRSGTFRERVMMKKAKKIQHLSMVSKERIPLQCWMIFQRNKKGARHRDLPNRSGQTSANLSNPASPFHRGYQLQQHHRHSGHKKMQPRRRD
jgi:hypothetical protein